MAISTPIFGRPIFVCSFLFPASLSQFLPGRVFPLALSRISFDELKETESNLAGFFVRPFEVMKEVYR